LLVRHLCSNYEDDEHKSQKAIDESKSFCLIHNVLRFKGLMKCVYLPDAPPAPIHDLRRAPPLVEKKAEEKLAEQALMSRFKNGKRTY
jgi:hypothetical protein